MWLALTAHLPRQMVPISRSQLLRIEAARAGNRNVTRGRLTAQLHRLFALAGL